MSLYYNFQSLVPTKRPITAHFVHYNVDGTGRDQYIFTNNGGLQHSNPSKRVQSLSSSWKFSTQKRENRNISSDHFMTHYISDGSGRDGYIFTDDGGISSGPGRHFLERFQKGLRKWDLHPQRSDKPKYKLNHLDDQYLQRLKQQQALCKKLSQIQPRKLRMNSPTVKEYKNIYFKPNLEDPYYLSNNSFQEVSRKRAISYQ